MEIKPIRDYLKRGSKLSGVPGGEEFYDSLKDDVRRYLDKSWPIISDLVLADYSTNIYLDMGIPSLDERSPIEQLMYLGLLRVFLNDFLTYPETCMLKVDTTLEEVSKFLEEKGHKRIYFPDDINYQLDFFLWLDKFLFGEKNRIRYAIGCIVECNGHDFHEKTKEQVRKDKSKDRALEERGLHVIRFTGSEITTDPEACSLQVKNYVDSEVDRIGRLMELKEAKEDQV